jgi:hypothetical protein
MTDLVTAYKLDNGQYLYHLVVESVNTNLKLIPVVMYLTYKLYIGVILAHKRYIKRKNKLELEMSLDKLMNPVKRKKRRFKHTAIIEKCIQYLKNRMHIP